MTARARHRVERRALRTISACLLGGLLMVTAAAADGVGVLLAPAADELSREEAAAVDALIVAIASHDLSVVLVHGESPLVRAADARLPHVSADADWTPLPGVLDALAFELRLDYLLLISVAAPPEPPTLFTGLLIVRGGASSRMEGEGAEAMAERVVRAADDLGPPRDRRDEAVDIPLAQEPPRIDEQRPSVADEQPAAVNEQPQPPQPQVQEEPAATPAAPPDVVPEPIRAEQEPADPLAVAEEPAPRADDAQPPQPDPELAAAEDAYESGKLDVASALLEDYVRTHGSSGRAQLLRAKLSLARLEQEAAVDQLQRAVALDPELVEARVWLARLLSEQGLWQKATEEYRRSLETNPENLEALLGLARVYRDNGHRRRAIRLLQEADEAGQSDPSLLLMLGLLHWAEGNDEQSERAFLRTAARADTEMRAEALEHLGDLYVERRQHREALRCYLEAAQLNPTRSSVAQRRYREVMAAADGAVHDALTNGWSVFEQYARDAIGQREMVYRHLRAVSAELEEALSFADGLTPPAALRGDHARRQLAYSLAIEATVSALTYLDLGEDTMLERAVTRHGEALLEFRGLQRESRG